MARSLDPQAGMWAGQGATEIDTMESIAGVILDVEVYGLQSTCQGVELIALFFGGTSMLSKTAEYALRAVVCLARDTTCTYSADSLAEQTQVPRRYLHKVLQDLCHAELVHSRSGPGGGYMLAELPDDISILDVVNAVAPVERIDHCPLALESHTTLCPLHRELDRAYAETEKSFSRVFIGQLVRSGGKISPLCENSPS